MQNNISSVLQTTELAACLTTSSGSVIQGMILLALPPPHTSTLSVIISLCFNMRYVFSPFAYNVKTFMLIYRKTKTTKLPEMCFNNVKFIWLVSDFF